MIYVIFLKKYSVPLQLQIVLFKFKWCYLFYVVSASIENLTKEIKSENNKKEKVTDLMKHNTRLENCFYLCNDF